MENFYFSNYMGLQKSNIFIQKISFCQQLNKHLLIVMCQALCQVWRVVGTEATKKLSGTICDSVLGQGSLPRAAVWCWIWGPVSHPAGEWQRITHYPPGRFWPFLESPDCRGPSWKPQLSLPSNYLCYGVLLP